MSLAIVARCPDTGQLGAAVSSPALAAGARAMFARARVGAVVVQGACDPRLGPAALRMLVGGYRPEAVIRAFARSQDNFEYRQLALIDDTGAGASHRAACDAGACATAEAKGCVAIGDRLADTETPQRMVAAWQATPGELAGRLLAALQAGAGEGGFRSAGLIVVERESWPLTDLRVDWSEAGEPVAELERLWRRWQPEMREHVARALDPAPPAARGRRG